MSYTGHISKSINTKEDKLMHSSLIKDWRNGWQHQIPVSASFTLFKYLNVTPSFNFTDRMYTNKVEKSWDATAQKEVCDTTYGFHNVYNWNMSVGMSTKIYGFYASLCIVLVLLDMVDGVFLRGVEAQAFFVDRSVKRWY